MNPFKFTIYRLIVLYGKVLYNTIVKKIIKEFDEYLHHMGLEFEGVVIGGAALLLIHVIDRATKDVDILSPEIPDEIKKSSVDFAKKNPKLSLNPNEWFNNGPYSLKRDLPKGWKNRLQRVFKGKSLTLFTLGRLDLLRAKLYAACDRDIDFDDCVALKPTNKELEDCLDWVLKGDSNPLWPKRVEEIYEKLKKELKNG